MGTSHLEQDHTEAEGAGTTRAPCTGPLATRTVRQTPSPAITVATSTAEDADEPVSYTHLTLPTILRV